MIVPYDTFILCDKFARTVLRTNLKKYAERNQHDLESIYFQIREGKIAEWAVYYDFLNRDIELSEPDMKIYPSGEKSFSADLIGGGFRYYIKSQTHTFMKKFGRSWIFQIEDPLFNSATEKDICILCLTNNHVVDILFKIPFKELKFEDPKIERLKRTGRVVYL